MAQTENITKSCDRCDAVEITEKGAPHRWSRMKYSQRGNLISPEAVVYDMCPTCTLAFNAFFEAHKALREDAEPLDLAV